MIDVVKVFPHTRLRRLTLDICCVNPLRKKKFSTRDETHTKYKCHFNKRELDANNQDVT